VTPQLSLLEDCHPEKKIVIPSEAKDLLVSDLRKPPALAAPAA